MVLYHPNHIRTWNLSQSKKQPPLKSMNTANDKYITAIYFGLLRRKLAIYRSKLLSRAIC